ncbi:hypothetical protein [Mesorhizobium sp. SARCC-RB16n]|uniref:hypothetical protein n=1 Tax=Mesorhizobium sp. SARCC-RB16n TaxID=2116687 RepID=UPI00122F27C6|nr:hypothetical protein [Mesorhizobium sp. SARCC-RB16n]
MRLWNTPFAYPAGSRKKIRDSAKWQKKLAVFSIHDIINDRIFLLIRRPATGGAARRLQQAIDAERYRFEVLPTGKIFGGKSFGVLPQGQDLHRRR